MPSFAYLFSEKCSKGDKRIPKETEGADKVNQEWRKVRKRREKTKKDERNDDLNIGSGKNERKNGR